MMMKSGNSHVGATYMILGAAIEKDWLKDIVLPGTPEQTWLARQLIGCLDVWLSFRHADSADEATKLTLREKQMGTQGRTKMTLVEWRTAYRRNVDRQIAAGKAGLRTPSELLVQQVDLHVKKEKNSSLKLHSDEVKALKNVAAWPEEFWRLLAGAWSRSEQHMSCWTVRSLAQPFLHAKQTPDCAPDNTLWVKVLTPSDSGRMSYSRRKDRFFQKQLLAVQKQNDILDNNLWQMALFFTWSIETEEALKIKTFAELKVACQQFIDSYFDTTCLRLVTEKPSTLEMASLPWLAPDGACDGGAPSTNASIFGTLTHEMEGLKLMEAQSEHDGYKKRLGLERAKHDRCKIDAEELLGQRRDKEQVVQRQSECWLLAAVQEIMRKYLLKGFKGSMALTTFMEQCAKDACETQPKIPIERLAHTRFVDLNARGQKWSCNFAEIHEEIVTHCVTHPENGQVILLAPTCPMYSAGPCPTHALHKEAMTKAFQYVRETLAKALSKRRNGEADIDSLVKISVSEVSINLDDVRESGGQNGSGVPVFSTGKVTFWQIIANTIDETTQDFKNPFGQGWTFVNGMIPGTVNLCDQSEMHQWELPHNAAVSKVAYEKRLVLALDSIDMYKAILKFTHKGCGAEHNTAREIVQDAIPPPFMGD